MLKVIELSFRDDVTPDAKKKRDKKARELRAEGYVVKTKTWDFIDLGRFKLYTLTAY